MKKGREEEKKRKQTIKVAAAKDILKMSFALFNMVHEIYEEKCEYVKLVPTGCQEVDKNHKCGEKIGWLTS